MGALGGLPQNKTTETVVAAFRDRNHNVGLSLHLAGPINNPAELLGKEAGPAQQCPAKGPAG